MILQLILDNPGPFTNLDVITGRVQLQVYSNTNVSHITVKLEAESRTRLLSPPRPEGSRPRPNLEIHKLLYKVATVFPPTDNVNRAGPGSGASFIIAPGQYSYPFTFKMPINNNCLANQTISTNMIIPGMSLELAKAPVQHVKTTLPPSIYFPGEAEIRYYLKATVNLPSFLKQNPRAFQAITFVPIEPPRSVQDGETYARRQHQFIHDNFPPGLGDRKGSTGSFLAKMARKDSIPSSPVSPSTPTREPARFSIDARLPNPAVLTCGEAVPLRLLVKQLNERNELLFLKTLQVELIGSTHIRAHDAVRTESNSWVLVSMSNINQSIGTITDAVGTETEITQEYWYGQKLPDSVPPSFTACNISRKYELKVSAGLAFGGMHGRNQFIVLPLHIDVEVFSGIKPPPELLKRTETNPPKRKPVPSEVSPAYAGPAAGLPAQSAPGHEDAPPSYEDVIAENVPPVDGPRPGYRPPPDTGGEESRITDSKR